MEQDIAGLLARQGMLLTYGAIFLGGLALNLTPCVYPLIPITVGYFTGQGESRRARVMVLSLLYVLGIAVTYSAIGVGAAFSGKMLGSLLQKAWVLGLFSGLMIALALSQFGLYELRVPSFLLPKRRGYSEPVQALMMGLTVGIVAAPCIGPFVLGLLLYVGQTRDPLTGFSMFLTLSLGLGLPYFLLGLFSGSLKSLPRSGSWLVWIKKIFGFILLGMAVYFAKPLIGEKAYDYGLALLGVAAAIALILDRSLRGSLRMRLVQTVPVVGFLAFSIWVLPGRAEPGVNWVTYGPDVFEQAKAEARPVLVDFYADWCLPCKELDKRTFSDPTVRKASEGIIMVKADVTLETSPANVDAQDRFEVEGVPTILFLDASGLEREDLRSVSFVPPGKMVEMLNKLKSGER